MVLFWWFSKEFSSFSTCQQHERNSWEERHWVTFFKLVNSGSGHYVPWRSSTQSFFRQYPSIFFYGYLAIFLSWNMSFLFGWYLDLCFDSLWLHCDVFSVGSCLFSLTHWASLLYNMVPFNPLENCQSTFLKLFLFSMPPLFSHYNFNSTFFRSF